jgi:ABC-2 type transport system permease protein
VFAILFVGSSLAMILPEVLDGGTTHYDVAVVTPAGAPSASGFETALRQAADGFDAKVRFTTMKLERRARHQVDTSKVDIAVVLGTAPRVIVRADENNTLVAFARQALASDALRRNLDGAGLSPAEVTDVLRLPPQRVEEIAVDDSDRTAAAAGLSLVLYLLLLILMIQVANGVAIEKANRISEVLLAVVRPGPLLFGKVIGVAIVGITGLLAGAIPIAVKAVAGGDLPAGLGPAVAGGAPWIILGLVLYLTIAGSLGALVERQEEAGSALGPLSLLLVATYILAQSSSGSPLGAFMALFPLTSPIVMPSRIALGDASSVEIVASLLIMVVSVAIAVRLGAAIFRHGIVHTGRRLHLVEALRSP